MWIAIGISVLFHAVLLALNFQFPEASKAFREKAMDIILVNAKSSRKPTDAKALAQANLDGGGNTDEERRAKTPLPPTTQQHDGDAVQQMQRRVQELETAQQRLLTQARNLRKVATATTSSEQPSPTVPVVSGLDLAESARAMARLEGEIAKTTEEYSKRPRKKFVGARTEEYALAAYLDAWKQKIERIGTLNYPPEARGKLYGAVVIFVELRAEDGSLYNAEISRSSGHKVLDQAALRILRMSAPFGPIPQQALGRATVLSFGRTWYFTQGDAFNTANK
ncbi:MAG: TonB family protein [Gammaproteobacteria bacterium]|nr:TonB family protein [Gammaproteobacteria bacterium]MBU1602258.1 TonB family protein [Gammaproteobacteria bacterium]MBU2433063.1 TonB family protein [Gammaproteobacteria bacterium]MBU2450977.1 TonB family protein [Gammaproteobacteria bacterium]